MNRRSVGTSYEEKAAEYLTQEGYQILEKNHRNKKGEIDLIAKDQEYLVFVEVKYRNDEEHGYGLESVDHRKQKRIIGAAIWYLCNQKISEELPCRFDVVSFDGEKISLIQNAFEVI